MPILQSSVVLGVDCLRASAGKDFQDVFQLCGLDGYPQGNYRKAGNISSQQDRTIGKAVLVLAGTVSAQCFLQIPGSPHSSLALSEKYLYLQVSNRYLRTTPVVC